MKNTLKKLLLVLFLGILSCQKNETIKFEEKNNTENLIKPYFDYNKIEYYHSNNNNSQEGISELYDEFKKNPKDSLKFKVLVGYIPENISDTAFVGKLNQIGFQKKYLSEKKQRELRKIFVEKNRVAEPKIALKPIFTDILIFKKSNKIVGISKLSIKYLQSIIIGSKLNSDYFPTDKEHKEIEEILYKN